MDWGLLIDEQWHFDLAPGSFDSRRELAIEVRDKHIVDRTHEVLKHDWENSHPLDLSDQGLLAELKEFDENVVEDLGLKPGHHT
ncbi:hypothetical protein [Alloacidobacterium sp.]|uniref:hypothetical protein n=1 Tax=Alloacidobacterium sp. TaxID=2951999 RepID=UPI002D3EB906|nr:hypothetical protein [Alloacidobacterium sp.]HYK36584.1 hypothetical protein [Alloacidobacterium sp.]